MLDHITNLEAAEALALTLAVLFSKEQNWHAVIVASDCPSVVQKLKSPNYNHLKTIGITREIKMLNSPLLPLIVCLSE
uniref:Uncharacterized protein n=1 Tax=Arundo donax TaxID=35708 RepID=A0A0A9M279_ARUDO